MKELLLKQTYDLGLDEVVEKFMFDDEFRTDYHKSLGHSEIAIKPWDSNKCRSVTFETPFNAPEIVKKFLGLGKTATSSVRQEHKYQKMESKVEIHIQTYLSGVPFAEHFYMLAIVTAEKQPRVTQMSIYCKLEFTGKIPGAKGTIEKQMHRDSELSWQAYLDLASKKAVSLAQSVAPIPPVVQETVVATSAHGSKSDQESAQVEVNNTHTDSNNPNRAPIHTHNADPHLLGSDPSILISHESMIRAMKAELEASQKQKSTLTKRVRDLEEKLVDLQNKFLQLSTLSRNPATKDILQELSITTIRLLDSEERLRRADQKFIRLLEEKDEIEKKKRHIQEEYEDKIRKMEERVLVLQVENDRLKLSLDDMVGIPASPEVSRRHGSQDTPRDKRSVSTDLVKDFERASIHDEKTNQSTSARVESSGPGSVAAPSHDKASSSTKKKK
eukprot:TRINITY_DN3534_c0_g1_i22.p1 TRINITY_DN3534_c0_g1~~TRINITY_DN3534_c0_g1_i22.p1  ORF type:complete len:444 (-),score=92.50 TRINITY_DN3534_c0_g1_i22:1767-3098(-)